MSRTHQKVFKVGFLCIGWDQKSKIPEITPPLLCLFKVKVIYVTGYIMGSFSDHLCFHFPKLLSYCKRYIVKPKIDLLRNLRITQISLIRKDLCENATKNI